MDKAVYAANVALLLIQGDAFALVSGRGIELVTTGTGLNLYQAVLQQGLIILVTFVLCFGCRRSGCSLINKGVGSHLPIEYMVGNKFVYRIFRTGVIVPVFAAIIIGGIIAQ